MDWTNNYGIRLLLPWNPKWFYGDFVFIIDPFLWLIFGGAAFLLTSRTRRQLVVWSLISLVLTYIVVLGPSQRGGLSDPTFVRVFWIAAILLLVLLRKLKAAQRWGSRVAIAAFIIASMYWGALAYAHSMAVQQARLMATIVANQNGESITTLAAMPTVANPFHWETVFETDRATYRFDLNLNSQADLSNLVRFENPSPDEGVLVDKALQDNRAQILMDFARFPVIRVDPNCIGQTLVQFADLRYTEPGRGRGTFSLDVPVECPPQTR
jgi:inner membrane protein